MDAWIQEFVECIAGVEGTSLDFEKGFLLRYRHMPKSIYKFREVNDYSIENLSTGTVWLTSPSKYNDPYDCAATISYAELTKSVPETVQRRIIQENRLDSFLTAEQIETALSTDEPVMAIARMMLQRDPTVKAEAIEPMLQVLRDAQARAMAPYLKDSVEYVRDGIKMCSFCATNRPIIMWSHYAKNHQGYCIEYDTATWPEPAKRMLFPVIYSSTMFDCTKYYAAAAKDIGNFNNVFAQVQALYKSPEWEYEQEWRLVFIGGIISKEMNYTVGLPKRVLLGARIEHADRERVIAVCRSTGTEVHQMKLVPDRFGLDSELVSL